MKVKLAAKIPFQSCNLSYINGISQLSAIFSKIIAIETKTPALENHGHISSTLSAIEELENSGR